MNITSIWLILGGLVLKNPKQQNLFFKRPGLESLLKVMHERFPGQLMRATLTGVDSTFPDDEMHLVPTDDHPI